MSSNEARKVETMCSTAKCTDEWVRSMVYVPANGRMAVDKVFSFLVGCQRSTFVPAGESTYHSAPYTSRPWPLVCPGSVSCSNR